MKSVGYHRTILGAIDGDIRHEGPGVEPKNAGELVVIRAEFDRRIDREQRSIVYKARTPRLASAGPPDLGARRNSTIQGA
jgi:hypothetical protein